MKVDNIIFQGNAGNDKIDDSRKVGNLIVKSNNDPNFGSIAVSSRTVSVGNMANYRARWAFIVDSIDNLKAMVEDYNLAPGSDYSQKIAPARLIVLESHEPFFKDQSPKLYPATHKEKPGEMVLSAGMPVYRQVHIVAANAETVVAGGRTWKAEDTPLPTDQEQPNYDEPESDVKAKAAEKTATETAKAETEG